LSGLSGGAPPRTPPHAARRREETSRKVRKVRKVMENNWDIFSFYLLFSLNRLKMLDNHKFLCYT
jgi:hypothetical protein